MIHFHADLLPDAIDTLVALIEEKEEGSIKQLEGRLIVCESCAVKY